MVTLTENGKRWTCLQLSKCARAFAVSQESKDSIIDARRQGPQLGSNILEGFCRADGDVLDRNGAG